jgi:choline-sulfatase
MPRGRRRALIAGAVAACAVGAYFAATGARTAPPEYVFLFCLDAVRPDHLGCYGYGVDTSPNLDRLASRGFLFEDAVSQAPWTTPSVATVLSSTFPCQHGARRTEGARVPYGDLPGNFVGNLGALGYQTGLFTGGIAIKNKVPASDLVTSALEWLKQNRGSKCLAVIHDYDTHSPYVGTPECVEALDPGYHGPIGLSFGDMAVLRQARVGRLADALKLDDADLGRIKALYDCQIMRSDRALGTLLDSLQAWRLLERSLIVVFSDHGEEFLEHGSIDHGQTVYEESIRVPLVVFCPALGSGHGRISQQVGLIDLAPTICEILGIERPSTFEGTSLAHLMSQRFPATALSRRPCGLPTGCLVAESIARRSEKKALRCPPWKLIFDPFFGEVELYDLSRDPGETRNLIAERPDVASDLADTLLAMEKYYPGGWCIAWRGEGPGNVRGRVTTDRELLEAVAHNFWPGVEYGADSLVTSEDWRAVRVIAAVAGQWQGVEIRMAAPADALADLRMLGSTSRGRQVAVAAVGSDLKARPFPLRVTPEEARVRRADLRDLFERARRAEFQFLVFWLEPGSEPAAKARREAERLRQLKAIGYID